MCQSRGERPSPALFESTMEERAQQSVGRVAILKEAIKAFEQICRQQEVDLYTWPTQPCTGLQNSDQAAAHFRILSEFRKWMLEAAEGELIDAKIMLSELYVH